ncbi:PI3/PI4 kinase family like protein [Nosema bombycis CQ1]|uniref:PI3/PI4 kinase family like protein n=1 Tax=Nosema bombycis (strain CQ1 / CVCC 102059) TaxID=578461 RepID=R0M0U2_NOSB1|nr:PI3/PI4 kinase family like protein [Nosema bombycis CQ1]|eukprot:EOB11649.1 PI3/PI4 kinase family like protein [Nosema bombycis CQ1]
MEVYKEIFLGQDPIDLKIEKISKLFDSDEFIPHIFFDEDFLSMYIPFSTLVLNSIESNEIRVFILTSLNKFTFKTIQNEEFVLALNRVLEEDNFHNVILTLKIFASLLKINIKSGNVVSKSMSPKKPLSPKPMSPKSPHSIKPSPTNKPPHSNKPLHSNNIPSVSLLDKHISVIVDLINSVFLKLDNFEESTVDTTFFTLSQIFGYVSDVIQRQPQTEKKIEGIVHRTVSFFRLFLEHRRVIDLTKYNKSFSLEMISTLSKLFKIFSDSPLFNIRNDALNSTIFELSKFSLFYCPTDAIDLRKELFYYIFKILLKNKEMYLPKIEEFFDIRFFYLDESYLINIKGLIGLTDLALVFSGNLSRRVPHELQRRTSEILESNLMMVHEKLKKCTFEDLENEDQNEEVKLNYEKSLKFHLEIVYECVNLIYKHTTIAEKFALQKAEFIDFCYKPFLLVSQVIESLKRIMKRSGINGSGGSNGGNGKVGDGKDNVNSNISLGLNKTTSTSTTTTPNTTTSHFSILKSTFLSLSKPLKEIADSLTALLKNNVKVAFPMADLFSAFKGVLEILEFSEFDEKDGQFVNEILLFFFTPFGGSVHLDFITGLISQMFATPFFMKIYLSILKRGDPLESTCRHASLTAWKLFVGWHQPSKPSRSRCWC